jgi:hypothetical protein
MGTEAMLKTDASATDDRVQTCSRARWRLDSDTVGYGIPGQELCASVEKDRGSDYYTWSYFVCCSVKQSQVQGRYGDPDTCLQEATHLLRKFDCPGNVTRQEKTWKQWVMIGQ